MTSKISNLLLIIKLNQELFKCDNVDVRCSNIDCINCPFLNAEALAETLNEIQKGEHHHV